MSDGNRLPPVSIEAEQGVLGSILLDNERYHDVAPLVFADDFHRESHQVMFREFAELIDNGDPVDGITFIDHLSRRGKLNEVGGYDAVFELLQNTPHAANAEYYARIVRDKAVSRRIIEAANAMLEAGYSNRYTGDEHYQLAESALIAVGNRVGGEVKTAAQAVTDSLAAYAERREGIRPGIQTNINGLNQRIGGWRNGRFYVVAARPSLGKSALVLNALGYTATEGTGSLLVSMEMGSAEIGDRLICGEAGVDGERYLKAVTLTHDECQAIDAAAHRVSKFPIYIDDRASRTITEILATARQLVMRGAIKLLAVDYLQLLDRDDRAVKQSRQEFIASVSRRLKTFALEMNIPVIAVSQLNRSAELRESKRPAMSDLRESGAIEQDADCIILIHRPDFYDPGGPPLPVELIVAKNRGGQPGIVKATFQREFTRFVDYVEPDGADPGYAANQTFPARAHLSNQPAY